MLSFRFGDFDFTTVVPNRGKEPPAEGESGGVKGPRRKPPKRYLEPPTFVFDSGLIEGIRIRAADRTKRKRCAATAHNTAEEGCTLRPKRRPRGQRTRKKTRKERKAQQTQQKYKRQARDAEEGRTEKQRTSVGKEPSHRTGRRVESTGARQNGRQNGIAKTAQTTCGEARNNA